MSAILASYRLEGATPERRGSGRARFRRMDRIRTIDCHYMGQKDLAAAYLLIDGEEAAFVENNTAHSVPLLLQALEEEGLSPEQVRYALVTHAHLDHAGGSSALLKACPNATLIAHPRAARHLIDPSRLVASATSVYGEERFAQFYGTLDPIPAERVRTMEDGDTLSFGSRTLSFTHTRGHANHHLIIHDPVTNGVFTGDAFGLAYPALQSRGPFTIPTTSPTDYLADEALSVVEQIVAMKPSRVYLTHFGERTEVEELGRQLIADLTVSKRIFEDAVTSGLEGDALEKRCLEALDTHLEDRFRKHGLEAVTAFEVLALDRELNAQGLAFAAMRARKTA